jgi:hypothetical protein
MHSHGSFVNATISPMTSDQSNFSRLRRCYYMKGMVTLAPLFESQGTKLYEEEENNLAKSDLDGIVHFDSLKDVRQTRFLVSLKR